MKPKKNTRGFDGAKHFVLSTFLLVTQLEQGAGQASSSMQARSRLSTGLIPKKQRQLLDDSFDQAKAKLDSQRGQGPFVLAAKVPQSVFDAWDDDGKAAWGIAYNSSTRSILMYGDTGWVHAHLQGYFLQEFTRQLLQLSMNIAGLSYDNSSYEQRSKAQDELGILDGFQPYGRTTMYTALGAKSPDASFYAVGFGARSVVVEIAHRNESFAALREEIAFWHAAGVGLALGFFVDPKSDKSNPNLILLSHLLEEPAAKQQRFGQMSGCSNPGLPVFQLQIPVSFLLESALHAALNRNINIDLYKVQQKVIEYWQAAHEYALLHTSAGIL